MLSTIDEGTLLALKMRVFMYLLSINFVTDYNICMRIPEVFRIMLFKLASLSIWHSGIGGLLKRHMTPSKHIQKSNSISDLSPSPSPSSTSAPTLVLTNSGKRIDHVGKKKYVKQVT
ncbi:hypothetical protein L2E82_22652 [Cichorium intybus]|uniref:Uncharacterized protein n=1 Tax=Cichorium intybus TaxID=13427 RepID=A0ACB9DZ02_CICIN|nr:hypothetical protein L2E82_22652 [Cichorium intybus]